MGFGQPSDTLSQQLLRRPFDIPAVLASRVQLSPSSHLHTTAEFPPIRLTLSNRFFHGYPTPGLLERHSCPEYGQ